MGIRTIVIIAVLTVALAAGASASAFGGDDRRHGKNRLSEKIVIAHRGASGYLPEHTLPAYAVAYAMGADYIEPDLVMTRDGVLICLHDIHLESVTNVEDVFPGRTREDGRWYAADFDLEEIKRLKARERLDFRFRQDSQGFQVPTLEEAIQLVQELNRLTGRNVGIYPETKAPAFHDAEGLSMEAPLLGVLAAHGYEGPDARVFIQSFDPRNLKEMRFTLGTGLPLVQLISGSPGPEGIYDWLVTDEGLDDIATYAVGIGPSKRRIEDENGNSVNRNALVKGAHARGLVVHPYTFRAESVFLIDKYGSMAREVRTFYRKYGVDGLFTDFPDIAVDVLKQKKEPFNRVLDGSSP